jgi:hypothetical protein
MGVDLSEPLYAALTGVSDGIDGLATYQGAPAVFTRRPVPIECGFPMIIAAGNVTYGDQDFIDAEMADIVRDIAVYGIKSKDSTKDQTRIVERAADDVRDLFHRKRESLIVPGWHVVDIRCKGPVPTGDDDDQTVGRVVSLQIRLTRAS